MGRRRRRAAPLVGFAASSDFRGLSRAASTQTPRTVPLSPRGVPRPRIGGLGIGDRLGNRDATGWRSHSSRPPWVCAGLDRDDLWIGCPSGGANSLGETRQTAWIPGRMDSALLPPKGALCALWLAGDALLD